MSWAPLSPPGTADRPLSVQKAVEPGYNVLVRQMLSQDITEEEVAVAIERLAQAHIETIFKTRGAVTEIHEFRNIIPPAENWSPHSPYGNMILSALFWCGVGVGGILVLLWMLELV